MAPPPPPPARPQQRTVLVVVPVVGLGGLGVGQLGGDVVPARRLDVLGVGHLRRVDPVGGLGRGGVLDLLGLQEVKVVAQRARLDLGAVNLHLVRVVGLDDERVAVRLLVRLALDRLLRLQVVLLRLAVEDHVRLARRVAALVRPEHDRVRRLAAKRLAVKALHRGEAAGNGWAARRAWRAAGGRSNAFATRPLNRGAAHLGQQLEVRAAAVEVLRVLDRVGDDQVLALVAARRERARERGRDEGGWRPRARCRTAPPRVRAASTRTRRAPTAAPRPRRSAHPAGGTRRARKNQGSAGGGPRARALTQAPNAAQPRPAHTWLVWMPPSPSTSFHAPRSASAFHVELVSHRFSQPASAGGGDRRGPTRVETGGEKRGEENTRRRPAKPRARRAPPGKRRLACTAATRERATPAARAKRRRGKTAPEQCAPSPSQHVAAEGRIFGPKEGAKVHSPNFSFR